MSLLWLSQAHDSGCAPSGGPGGLHGVLLGGPHMTGVDTARHHVRDWQPRKSFSSRGETPADSLKRTDVTQVPCLFNVSDRLGESVVSRTTGAKDLAEFLNHY